MPENTSSMMMMSRPNSKSWIASLVTFIFQTILDILIAYDQIFPDIDVELGLWPDSGLTHVVTHESIIPKSDSPILPIGDSDEWISEQMSDSSMPHISFI